MRMWLADSTYGIASFSVQVETYKALLAAQELLTSELPYEEKVLLERRIGRLRQNIPEAFWVEDERGGFFALGLERQKDGSLAPLTIRTSDMGHILNSDLLEGDDPDIVRKREMLIATLNAHDMLAPAGIRTLSSLETRFDEDGYHLGSVWLRENYILSQGYRRHGYHALANDIDWRTIKIWRALGVFPEFVRGGTNTDPQIPRWVVDVYDKDRDRVYRLRQPPQLIQAWSVGAVIRAMENLGEAA